MTSPTTAFNARHTAQVELNVASNLWHKRLLISRLISHNFQSRFRGSQLGLLWSLLSPLVMLAAYTFVFSTVLQARWNQDGALVDSTSQFALILFAGLIPYAAFAETLNNSPRTILAVPNYVKRVVFPLEVLPVVTAGSALIQSVISVAVLLVASLVLTGSIHASLVWLPVAYVPLVLLCLAFAWILASLGTYLRDVGQTVLILSQLLLFVSPIFYPAAIVPEPFRTVIELNPLTGIIESFRRALVWNQGLDWTGWSISVLFSLFLAYAGYLWFMKTKAGFADVL
jgi:lipopolysaccharide transport system permease protein